MSRSVLEQQRLLWAGKPQLRSIYEDFYRRLVAACQDGSKLEIGGGSGNLKAWATDVIATDIVPVPWLDLAADAQALPFAGESLGNIVAVDVLHHIERPRRFLAEAQRVLKTGGRLILLEPAITPLSWFFYRFAHPEPLDLGADPLDDGPLAAGRRPFDANQAIPTLLFGRHRRRMEDLFPLLRLIELRHLSLLAYPLSGGFRPWSLVPAGMVGKLLRFEDKVAPLLGGLMAFRLFAVLEKRAACNDPDTKGAGLA